MTASDTIRYITIVSMFIFYIPVAVTIITIDSIKNPDPSRSFFEHLIKASS